MIVFLVLGGVGLFVVLLSMLFGELLDLLDGAISGASLGASLTIFGATGSIVTANGLPVWVAYTGSASIAVLGYLVILRLIARFRDSDDGEPEDPTGMLGSARTPITSRGGDVALDGPRELETRVAFSNVDIPTGARLQVVSVQGATVQVIPILQDNEKVQ